MLKTRVITALVLIVLFLAALIWLAPRAWAVFAAILVMPAAWEWGRLIKLKPAACSLYVILIGAVCAALYVWAQSHAASGQHSVQTLVYLIASVFWVAVVPLWLWRSRLPQSRVLGALTGCIVLIPTWLAMVELRNSDPALLFLVMAIAWISDIAAYFAGRRYGRHKLAPAISPGKTWEGAAGAVLAISAYALLWSYAWPQYVPHFVKISPLGAFGMLLFVWPLTAFGIYGDLFESAMKRHAGVKDSGTLLPGHGGVLDRIDALTAILPLAALGYLS